MFSKIKAESAAKERRIRDIDALFGTIQTIRELKSIQQVYESIHWSGKREKYKAEHGDELSRLQKAIWLREKLMKSLGLASPLDKEQRAALKAEREAILPKLEEVKGELAERNRIRYWTRKVVPDALPRVSDGRVSVEDAMETAVNRKELEQVKDEAARMAAHQPQKQEKQETPIGVYGQRRTFLKEHHRVLYDNLLNAGTLHDHLVDIEEQAQGDGLRLFCI